MNSKFLLVETSKILTSTYRVERNIEDDGVLIELKNNIEKYGIKVPLIVTLTDNAKYKLIDGHRRLQVAINLGLQTVPCVIDDSNSPFEIALSVNLHREDLTSIEIGQLLLQIYNEQKAIDNTFKYAKLSTLVNKSKAYIAQHVGYVEKLVPEIQQDILDNKRFIDKNTLNKIYVLDEANQKNIYDQMIDKKLNREAVQNLIDELDKKKVEENNTDEDEIPSTITPQSVPIEALYISNGYVEFKLKSNVLDANKKQQFENELLTLLKKYNLEV